MTAIPAALGLTSEQVEELLATAGRAPSLHNSQPWRFTVTPHVIELRADFERRLPVIDPDDRELRMACGAALFNLRLALHRHGIRPLVTVLPDRRRPDLLAAVRHGGTKPPTVDQLRLLRAVPRWRTNRMPFDDVEVPSHARHALRRAALDEGAWLHVVRDPGQRSALQRMAVRAHRLQMEDPEFRAELARWTAITNGRRDGVPLTAAGPAPAPQDRWVLRDFGGGAAPERAPGADFEEEPVIGVLTSHLSGPAAEIRVGLALQRVLLTATADGLAVSFLSQVVEVPKVREELRRLISGTRPPQAVLRVGHGSPVATTPRREVARMLAHPATS